MGHSTNKILNVKNYRKMNNILFICKCVDRRLRSQKIITNILLFLNISKKRVLRNSELVPKVIPNTKLPLKTAKTKYIFFSITFEFTGSDQFVVNFLGIFLDRFDIVSSFYVSDVWMRTKILI